MARFTGYKCDVCDKGGGCRSSCPPPTRRSDPRTGPVTSAAANEVEILQSIRAALDPRPQ